MGRVGPPDVVQVGVPLRIDLGRSYQPAPVLGVGVLLVVEVLLDGPTGIGQEGPLGADRGAELLQGVMVVGGDSGDLV